MPNIEGVRVTQTLWGRLFGYGRIRIEGTGDDHIDIPNIDDPVGFRRAIETAKAPEREPDGTDQFCGGMTQNQATRAISGREASLTAP